MKSTVINVKGQIFIGKSESNHWMIMDGEERFGGYMAAVRPMEAILIALGGCTGMDVSSILSKMKVKYDSFEIEIEAERAEEHPKVFTKIDIKYKFRGKDLPKDKIDKAIRLSQEKYCPVSEMLRKTAELNWELILEDY